MHRLVPEAGPLLAAIFLGVGTFALTAQRSTEPPAHPRGHHCGGSALRSAGLRRRVLGEQFFRVFPEGLPVAPRGRHRACSTVA